MRVIGSLLSFALVACGGSDSPGVATDLTLPSPDSPGSSSGLTGIFPGALDQCNASKPAALARCTSATAATAAAAICGDLVSGNTLDVAGTLRVDGSWTVRAPATVSGDVIVKGKIDATNTLTVSGQKRAGAESGLVCTRTIDPALENATDATGSLGSIDEPTELTMGCGNFRLASLNAQNTLTIHVRGDSVLAIVGGFRVSSPVVFDVASGVRFDLVVGGALDIQNTLTIKGGSSYVAVAGAVTVNSPTSIDGWLVAPRSAVAANNTLDVHGALFAGSMRVASPVHVTSPPTINGDACVR